MVPQRGIGRPKGLERGYRLRPIGVCVCPKCRKKVPKQKRIPCTETKCPQCGSMMIRG